MIVFPGRRSLELKAATASPRVEPVPTFAFLKRYAKIRGHWGRRHDQPFHVVGSDAAGVVLRTGNAVTKW